MMKASFKAIKDLRFDGMRDYYIVYPMTRMQGSRYLTFDGSSSNTYTIDIDTLKATKLDMDIGWITDFFIDGDYVIALRNDKSTAILKDLVMIGEIEFNVKIKKCKNNERILGRYAQQVDQTVYAMDEDNRLYRIEWQDIKDGKYCETLVRSEVKHFFAERRLGLATILTNDKLSLPSGTDVGLRTVDSKIKWTIVTYIAKCWIVSGDLDGQAIMTSISNKGDVRSTLKLQLTSNGYVNGQGNKYGGIFSIRQAFVSHRRGIMMAIERDGCCHLISISYGRMSVIQSIDSFVTPEEDYRRLRVVMAVTVTHTEGVFIVGGVNWSKMISVKI